MALVVEDGTGIANADSYFDLTYVDNHILLYGGGGAWDTLTVLEKEQLVRKTTKFVDNNYNWFSRRLTATQGLEFPRETFYDTSGCLIEGVPVLFKDAIVDLILFGTENDILELDPGYKRESYGRTSVEYVTAKKTSGLVAKAFSSLSRYGSNTTYQVRLIRS